MHTDNKIATEDDVYDVLVSSSYLYASGEFSRPRNRQTRPRRFWVHDRPVSESESERQRARNGASESERYFFPRASDNTYERVKASEI